jgi:hypothetical protein
VIDADTVTETATQTIDSDQSLRMQGSNALRILIGSQSQRWERQKVSLR